MNILTIDIETSPNLAHVWSLWNQNVGLAQLREATEIMCFAAKWHGEREVIFKSTYHDSPQDMLQTANTLMSQADILVHYNGMQFDVKHMNREFVTHGYGKPSPFFNVDLLRVVKKHFRFPSNKLDYVAGVLLGANKVKHTGHQLWVDCIAGDATAWDKMRKYNIGDVRLTEKLYDKLLPWIDNHPHPGLFDPSLEHSCPSCGNVDLTKEGFAYTRQSVFQRYSCHQCGRWSRGNKRVSAVEVL